MRDVQEELKAKNIAVIGISPDTPETQKKFDDKHNLGFPLLSDPEHDVAEAYGVWGEKKLYGNSYMGIIRSHFIVDEAGKLADVQVKISPKKSIEKGVKFLSQ